MWYLLTILGGAAFGPLLCAGASYVRDIPNCGDEAIDACGTEFISFGHGPRLPENETHLAQSCKRQLKGIECANEYSERCLLGFFRGSAVTALITLQEETERKCDATHPDHKRYLKSAACLNKAGDRIHKCVQNFREDLYQIALKAPPKQKIRYACCEYSKMFSCKQTSLRENCGDPKALQYVRETAEHILHNLVKVFCGRYESGSDECGSLEKLPALDANDNAPKSFILLLKSFAASVP
uniref:DUF19 domain-containing protein n=1 Tax=Amblyomma maculatum TaxID=34609 RepID=G3MQN6_AMBMU